MYLCPIHACGLLDSEEYIRAFKTPYGCLISSFLLKFFFFFWSACCLPQLLLTPQGAVGFPGGKAVENPPGNAEEMRRKWQPTPVFVSGKVHGQRSLAGYSPWCFKESDTISVCARAHTHTHTHTHTRSCNVQQLLIAFDKPVWEKAINALGKL